MRLTCTGSGTEDNERPTSGKWCAKSRSTGAGGHGAYLWPVRSGDYRRHAVPASALCAAVATFAVLTVAGIFAYSFYDRSKNNIVQAASAPKPGLFDDLIPKERLASRPRAASASLTLPQPSQPNFTDLPRQPHPYLTSPFALESTSVAIAPTGWRHLR